MLNADWTEFKGIRIRFWNVDSATGQTNDLAEARTSVRGERARLDMEIWDPRALGRRAAFGNVTGRGPVEIGGDVRDAGEVQLDGDLYAYGRLTSGSGGVCRVWAECRLKQK